MHRLQKTDIFLNVILPIILGIGTYYVANFFVLNTYIRNQLPDGLWAYSLMSCMLIVWNRKINFFWTSMIFIFCILFETLQYLQLINGTADYLDILAYFVFLSVALSSNRYFSTAFKIKYENK